MKALNNHPMKRLGGGIRSAYQLALVVLNPAPSVVVLNLLPATPSSPNAKKT